MHHYRVAILTVSDTASSDPSLDRSGPIIRDILISAGRDTKFEVIKSEILPDDEKAIADWVRDLSRPSVCDWILTTGGTGFGSRDRTPEAITNLIERHAPGLVHLMMASSLLHTPLAALSRPVVGTIGNTLIVTLPGSPKAVKENLSTTFLSVVDHALDLIKGGSGKAVHKALGVGERNPVHGGPAISKLAQDVRVSSTNMIPQHIKHNAGDPIVATGDTFPSVLEPRQSHSHHHHHPPTPHTKKSAHDPTGPVTSRHRQSPYPIISFQEALRSIFNYCKPLDVQTRKLDGALPGHVLAEDVYATHNIPSTRTTNVDGYALRSNQGPGIYQVATPATHAIGLALPPNTIMRVNTGAPVPHGTDAVIMVEDTRLESTTKNEQGEDIEEKTVETFVKMKPRENTRQAGSDVIAGEKVAELGEIITAGGGEIGALAFVGRSEVKVFRRPVVALLSTGNEIVDVQETRAKVEDDPDEWTGIYDTNRPSLRAALEGMGYEVVDLGILKDSVDAHVQALKEGLEKADIVVTTGGSSMGVSDLLKPVIEKQLGGTIHFGRVSIKPGKPTTFATVPIRGQDLLAAENKTTSPTSPPSASTCKPIFGLPGNPASALVTFWIFVVPALRRMGGYTKERCCLPRAKVLLNEDLPLDPRQEFHRVMIRCTTHGLKAFSTGGQRSSRVASMAGANGLVVLPMKGKGKDKLAKGTYADAIIIGELLM